MFSVAPSQANNTATLDVFEAAKPHQVGPLRWVGWNQADADIFLDHLGLNTFHAAVDRDFKKSYRTGENGASQPKRLRRGHKALKRMQYAVLTTAERAAVAVVDVDLPGAPGGRAVDLNPRVFEALNALRDRGVLPNWVGINPIKGTGQLIFYVDPVYAAPGQSSPNMRLYEAFLSEVDKFVGGDGSFSHRFSRWPLYQGNDPTAYRWHAQHHEVFRLANLMGEVREMTNSPEPQEKTAQQYESGWARIEAARKNSQAARDLAKLDAELTSVSELDGSLIDGVRVFWIAEGHAARDDTAFRHVVAVAHQLRAAQKPMTDAALIDAYEEAYEVAQAVGSDGRQPDIPPMKDRLSMARRVRSYVSRGRPSAGDVAGRSISRQTLQGRRALATLGTRGGKTAARRWKTDPSYVEAASAPLREANRRRRAGTAAHKARIQAAYADAQARNLTPPKTKELAEQLDVSVRRVQMLKRELGLNGSRGRTKSETP